MPNFEVGAAAAAAGDATATPVQQVQEVVAGTLKRRGRPSATSTRTAEVDASAAAYDAVTGSQRNLRRKTDLSDGDTSSNPFAQACNWRRGVSS